MSRIIVLGAGMVGSAMALDLAKKHEVTSADIKFENREKMEAAGIEILTKDLSQPVAISKLVSSYDLVIGALPGFMGFEALKEIIDAGKNVVDISFFPEDPYELDDLARANGVTAFVDCGVAPGMSNFLLGYHAVRMDVESFEFMVGGLPSERRLPHQYKAPFSPVDVIEEYTRPARFVEGGREVVYPPLSGREMVNIPGIGTLEAFNTDGLRTLIRTMNVPDMKEKTLRYPGHIDRIKFLSDCGFFSKKKIKVGNNEVCPLEMTSAILFPQWKLGINEEELTVMKVIIEGREKTIPQKYEYDLLDRYDAESGISSMARTTGYSATAIANLFLDVNFEQKGIIPPELISADEKNYHYVLSYLESRGVYYKKKAQI